MDLQKYLGLAIAGFAFVIAGSGFVIASFGYQNVGASAIKVAFGIFVAGFIIHVAMMVRKK